MFYDIDREFIQAYNDNNFKEELHYGENEIFSR